MKEPNQLTYDQILEAQQIVSDMWSETEEFYRDFYHKWAVRRIENPNFSEADMWRELGAIEGPIENA